MLKLYPWTLPEINMTYHLTSSGFDPAVGWCVFPNSAESLVKFRKQDIRISQLSQFMGIIKHPLLPLAVEARQGETQCCKVIMTKEFSIYLTKSSGNTACIFEAAFLTLWPKINSSSLSFILLYRDISEFTQSQNCLLLNHYKRQWFFFLFLEVFPYVCSVSTLGFAKLVVLTAGAPSLSFPQSILLLN